MAVNEVRAYFQEITDLGHFCPPGTADAHPCGVVVGNPGIFQAYSGSEWWQSSKLGWTGF
jgi:hypothetical protein